MGRARRPSHSILPRSRAEQSLRASLDPARTYLKQGGGYDSRQCRADTQLAMIGVSMRVTPNAFFRFSRSSISSINVWFSLDLPIPAPIWLLAQIVVMNSIARFAQGPAIEHHIERGGNLASVWNAMGIGFLCAVVCAVAIRFGVSTALFEPGSVVEFNNADEVVYLGAATVDDARFLGEALTRYGVFGAPAGTVVKITASSDMYTISFFFFDKPWEEPDAIAIYEELGEVLADARFGRPFAIRIVR